MSQPNVWRLLDDDGTGSGSQPSLLPPEWWPKVNKKPVTHVYRIMRVDMDDIQFCSETFRDVARMKRDSKEFISETLRAVAKGCNYRTPFLHASLSLTAAHEWGVMAMESGLKWDPTYETLAVRIDIWAWYQSGEVPEQGIIDLPSLAQQRLFIKYQTHDYAIEQEAVVRRFVFHNAKKKCYCVGAERFQSSTSKLSTIAMAKYWETWTTCWTWFENMERNVIAPAIWLAAKEVKVVCPLRAPRILLGEVLL